MNSTPHRKTKFLRASGLLGGLILLTLLQVSAVLAAEDPEHPLRPPDRSSPRAALKTFLDSGDAVGNFLVHEYLPSPSRAEFHQLAALGESLVRCLDLSEVPPAARLKVGRAAAGELYATLSRIQLPPLDEIPGTEQLNPPAGTNAVRWVIPDTEIVLERPGSGPRAGEFLFSPSTVSRAHEFYSRVKHRASARQVPLENFTELGAVGGGWMIPHGWIQFLPSPLRAIICGQAVWKWFALVILTFFFGLFLRFAYQFSQRGKPEQPFRQALAGALLPASILLGTPVFAYLSLVQFNLTGSVGSGVELAATGIEFIAGAWICWRVAPVISEAIIASPKIAPESVNAHLIRICTRLLGILAGAALLAAGADRLGLPLYGIIAGLGVGGLAIALAAQPTIENLIGGLSLFADKPIRVGDFCQYGTDTGTVEAIGIRSTRIRGTDRTLTTIPNAVLSKMPVVNFTRRDRLFIKTTIGVRYETSPEQLRFLLVRIREMLVSHPRLHPEGARARFVGFGESSLNIEIAAYVSSTDYSEFLAVREDVLLRVMEIVEQTGTGFAFPSRTMYFARDGGLDRDLAEAAEAQVRQWREGGCLPFPNFTSEQLAQLRGTLAYPPSGSPQPAATPPTRSPETNAPSQSATPPSDQPKEPNLGI